MSSFPIAHPARAHTALEHSLAHGHRLGSQLQGNQAPPVFAIVPWSAVCFPIKAWYFALLQTTSKSSYS